MFETGTCTMSLKFARIKKVKLRFIYTLLREITSFKCFVGFCDTLDVFRELFSEVKKFSVESLVPSILTITYNAQTMYMLPLRTAKCRSSS